jgi:3-oxoacyl-[acyl-carrier protein] reductase
LARSNPSRLKGKVALVTGASRGIGLAIARALATEGCQVIVTGRNQAELIKARGEVRGQKTGVFPMVCDVRDSESVESVIRQIKKQFRRLDILVNNAGIGHDNRSVADLSCEIWRDVIDTNLNGMFLVTHGALSLMRRGGVIVNNLSIAAKRVFPGSSAYNASKHGALGFTDTLREELRSRGIRVIALLPGATNTAIWKTLWPDAPRKKMMSPATVATALMNAVLLPENSTLEELVLLPAVGTL